jgi:AraC family transcriptional activator of pobA
MLAISNIVLEQELDDSFRVMRRDNFKPAQVAGYRLIYHHIFFIEGGEGSLQIDERTFQLSGPQLFLLSKGQIYKFDKQSKFSGFELSFGDFFWEKSPASANNCKAVLFNDASLNQLILLCADDTIELRFLINILHQEYLKTDYINKADAMAAFLKIIMIKTANINAALINGFDNFEKQIYRKFLAMISKNYQSSHGVTNYAERLGVTARKLTDLCKRHSGRGAKDLINDHLIAEAKRSLQFSSVSVKEISFQLNFSTPEQFSHFFKRNTADSPQKYRTDFVNIGM